MLVKEVIAMAAGHLGREDLVSLAQSNRLPQGEILSLVRCYNVIENEIALEYVPLYQEEILDVVDGKVYYTSFSYAPVDMKRVEGLDGKSLSYRQFPAYLEVDGGETVKVSYAYSPTEKAFTDECAFGEKISIRLLSLGVASEFLLSRGQFSEASVWHKRYQDALRSACYRRSARRMRSRRWV